MAVDVDALAVALVAPVSARSYDRVGLKLCSLI